jgi:hypothetical protein
MSVDSVALATSEWPVPDEAREPEPRARSTRVRDRAHARVQLRRLDACLSVLEDAHEEDLTRVSAELALRVRHLVPGVRPGMLITDALDLVFQEQEQYLLGAQGDSEHAEGRFSLAWPPETGMALPPNSQDAWTEKLDEQGARQLTERIRSTTRLVCLLLMEAHERRAWLLLGYRTWEQYVQKEFGFSRSRSYELVDQARVILAIRAAAGMSEVPDISAFAAQQIKPHMAGVLRTISERVPALPRERMTEAVAEIVREARATRRAAGAAPRPASPVCEVLAPAFGADRAPDLHRLFRAIESLGKLPSPPEMVTIIGERHGNRLDDIERALHWLTELVRCWRLVQGEPRPLSAAR